MTTTTTDAVDVLEYAMLEATGGYTKGAAKAVVDFLELEGFTITRTEPASAALAASITEAEHWKTRYTQLENKVKVAKRELEKEELYDALSTLEEALTVQEPQK